MESVKFGIAIAALAGTGLWLPALAATPVATNATPATPVPQAIPAQVPLAPPLPAVHNGGIHAVSRPASAVSGARDDNDVQTTIEDGRKVTRNAHMPDAARVGSTPNN